MQKLFRHHILRIACGALLFLPVSAVYAETIYIESWRADDVAIWKEKILPVFEAANPGLFVRFEPTNANDYNSELNGRLEEGRAGDIITCRPFDDGLSLFQAGHLEDLQSLEGMQNYSDFAKAAWSTDNGDANYCVPMASVIHGFMYSKDAFKEVGVEVPKTQAEFFAVLDKLKNESSYLPMAMGTKDTWATALMGYNNIGPSYWKGEEGRVGLLKGEAKFTDEAFVETFRQLAKWAPYLGEDFQTQSYDESRELFSFGRAAIYPTGSWEITEFLKRDYVELGAFPPPSADGKCYLSDHTDIGLGMNANTKNKEAVMKFLTWTTTAEFAGLLTNAAPGYFSLTNHEIEVENSLASDFANMRKDCESTIRLTYKILSRGEPQMRKLLWKLSADVINGTQTPEQAAAEAQAHLEKTYKPILQSLNED